MANFSPGYQFASQSGAGAAPVSSGFLVRSASGAWTFSTVGPPAGFLTLQPSGALRPTEGGDDDGRVVQIGGTFRAY